MLSLYNISVIHSSRHGEVRSLDRLSLDVEAGQFVVVRGPSGCGKTTLLLTAGGMLRPTSGRVAVDGHDIYAMSQSDRNRFRCRGIGFVFQMFHLLPYLNSRDNILLAAIGRTKPDESKRALDWLARLGLEQRAHHKPAALSTGERQRVAVVRALFNKPGLLLADEPTGNLDPANAREVFRMIQEFHRTGGTVILATHGPPGDIGADRTVEMRAGSITS